MNGHSNRRVTDCNTAHILYTYLDNIKNTCRRHHNTYLQQRRDDLDELPGRLYFIHRSLATAAAAGKTRTHNPEKRFILPLYFIIIL